jgi:exopolyphosphatase/pppGpp-phosphohydrolase
MLSAIRWMLAFRAAPPSTTLPPSRPRTVEHDLMTNTRARELVHDAARRVEEIADGLGDTNVGEALYALSGACRLLAEVTEKQDRGGHD